MKKIMLLAVAVLIVSALLICTAVLLPGKLAAGQLAENEANNHRELETVLDKTKAANLAIQKSASEPVTAPRFHESYDR